MCRLSAIIGAVPDKALLMHMLMLYGSAEPWQSDGWGITDGQLGIRAYTPYYETGAISGLRSEVPWLGHVRNASANTELSTDAAHPYQFTTFWGAHNGQIDEVYKPQILGPDTDSYRAFYILDRLCRVDGVQSSTLFDALAENLFHEWMNLFGGVTTFAFGLHVQDSIIFIRNKDRSLWYVEVEGGYLIHTSRSALLNVLYFAQTYLQRYHDVEVLSIPEDTLVLFGSEQRVLLTPVSYKFAELQRHKNKRRRR